MSFDIYLIAGPGRTFDRSIVEEAFAAMIDGDRADDEWNLHYLDGSPSHALVSIDTGPQIDGFSVNRPPSETATEFWDAIFQVLRQTESFLVWPATGEPGYCVARDDWESFLPKEDFDHMGRPARVTCGRDIPELFYETGGWLRPGEHWWDKRQG